jgi:hypothetical protein
MTLGQLGLPQPSLGGLVAALGTKLSRVALHQRFTASAVAFLHRCLRFVLRQRLARVPRLQPLALRSFRRVLIADSSSWDVSAKLRQVLPGSGGGASEANCKIQVLYDYTAGALAFLDVTPGILPDNRYTDRLPARLGPEDLLLVDQGYFKLTTWQAIAARGAFFLTRFIVHTTLRAADTGAVLDLKTLLRRHPTQAQEFHVLLGPAPAGTSACRLLCLPASEQLANERRRRLRKEAAKKGRTVSQLHLELCAWTLLVTNLPADRLAADQALALYALRWQIELLFKQLKSTLRVHQSDTGKEPRLRCELYGKLILAVLLHRLHAAATLGLWQTTRHEISLAKFYKRVQERAFLILTLLQDRRAVALAYLTTELKRLLPHCLKATQRTRLTTLETLDTAPAGPAELAATVTLT